MSAATEPTVRPRFYFVNEVAAELRRSEKAVRWMIHTGRIKTGKLSGRVIVSADEVDRVINEAFEEPAS